MASFTELAGVIVVREPPGRLRRRIRREIKRIGWFRFFDVLAFRLYYKIALASADHAWTEVRLAELAERYEEVPSSTSILETASPNSKRAQALLERVQPDFVVARCKNLLAKRIFSIPTSGTYVMHPGVCPEYRNAHGCFWALANRDMERVGMTLLRIDEGVDTGPVYGYYSYDFDERNESHIVIQDRVVLDNLDALRARFEEIVRGEGESLETAGRESRAWGQPWLTSYLRWKRAARRTG